MKNKWLKWVIGFGGVSAFTLFLQSIDTSGQIASNNDVAVPTQTENILNNNQVSLATTNEELELDVDWDEDEWDVEYGDGAIIATPNASTSYLDRASQQTRRS
ncbi:hypothetical protein ACNQFZ_08570 [Schinkia sp. CFF1]